MNPTSDSACLRGVQVLLEDHFCIQRGEQVVLTCDEHTSLPLVRALSDGAVRLGAGLTVLTMPQLPFQGSLGDPHIPHPVAAAVRESDVWLDMTFPYMAGSGPFDAAMEHKRTRYLLVGDLTAAGMGRLYGTSDFDTLFALQSATDALFVNAQGKKGRITSPAGTDIEFVFAKPATTKHRRATQPGAQTIPGSAIFYPELDSVKGTIVLEAAFHEYYTPLREPIALDVDGVVRSIQGGSDVPVMDRALRRAGKGQYGHVIHLSVGLNPGARMTGSSFIEDIRTVGTNAVGLGLPWWLPGGGENHPDGVVRQQSLWIDGELIIDKGLPVATHPIAALLRAASPAVAPSVKA